MKFPYFQDHSYSDSVIKLIALSEQNGKGLKIIFEEERAGKKTTLKQYFKSKVSLRELNALSKEIYYILYQSSHFSKVTKSEELKKLQQSALALYNSIFPPPVKEKLSASNARTLSITIDDSLINIPWELLYDGEDFLCLHFNMGRNVYTTHHSVEPKILDIEKIRMWILTDPNKDIPMSYEEGKQLYKKFEDYSDNLDVIFQSFNITTNRVSRQIFDFNILHYAGHAVYNSDDPGMSGWQLEDDVLTAQTVINLAGCKRSFPALVFSNACQSGQTSLWTDPGSEKLNSYHAYDMVNAFLCCGVLHYIGTFQDIPDIASLSLATHFYTFLMQSYSIGESLRNARLKVIEESIKQRKENLIWAYYTLYGDPTIIYLNPQSDSRDIPAGSYRKEKKVGGVKKTCKDKDIKRDFKAGMKALDKKGHYNAHEGIRADTYEDAESAFQGFSHEEGEYTDISDSGGKRKNDKMCILKGLKANIYKYGEALCILIAIITFFFLIKRNRFLNSPKGDWIEEFTGMRFVWVPKGCFTMGCGSWMIDCESNEKPVHKVCVEGIWMGKYEVTQGEWDKVMGYNPSMFHFGENYPVEKVSWYEVQDFLRKLSLLNEGKYKFRLPAEAEWEYASRSTGKEDIFSGGNQLDYVAWYAGNSNGETHIVGTKSPTSLGLYDMSGNVMEWCNDTYSEYTENSAVMYHYKVVRGGSWADESRRQRTTFRSYFPPASMNVRLGFRIVRER